ncbi:hypothetical protein D3C78_1388360 [compost metagenome]
MLQSTIEVVYQTIRTLQIISPLCDKVVSTEIDRTTTQLNNTLLELIKIEQEMEESK